MRGYGLPRVFRYPDVGEIQELGLQSSFGKLPGKGGEIRSQFKNSDDKRRTRRIYKRRARAEGKKACDNQD